MEKTFINSKKIVVVEYKYATRIGGILDEKGNWIDYIEIEMMETKDPEVYLVDTDEDIKKLNELIYRAENDVTNITITQGVYNYYGKDYECTLILCTKKDY